MTVAEALRTTIERLHNADIESASAEASTLLEHLLGMTRSDLLAERRTLSENQVKALETLLVRRTRREPLQHILSTSHFYGLELHVTPEVLIPRPETERLVELALEQLKPLPRPKVLDIGTGSGAVALAIQAERPDAEVVGTDVSKAALRVARENAARLGLGVHFLASDLLDADEVRAFAVRTDLLVSNPPYLPATDIEMVSPEVRADPALALYSGPDGLKHFRRLERQAFRLLEEGAGCLLELDPRNVAAAREASSAWARKNVYADLAGRRRFLGLER